MTFCAEPASRILPASCSTPSKSPQPAAHGPAAVRKPASATRSQLSPTQQQQRGDSEGSSKSPAVPLIAALVPTAVVLLVVAALAALLVRRRRRKHLANHVARGDGSTRPGSAKTVHSRSAGTSGHGPMHAKSGSGKQSGSTPQLQAEFDSVNAGMHSSFPQDSSLDNNVSAGSMNAQSVGASLSPDARTLARRIVPASGNRTSTLTASSQSSMTHFVRALPATLQKPDERVRVETAFMNMAEAEPPVLLAGRYMILLESPVWGGQAVVVFARDQSGVYPYAIKCAATLPAATDAPGFATHCNGTPLGCLRQVSSCSVTLAIRRWCITCTYVEAA